MPFFNISDLIWGDRLSQTDKRQVARDIVTRDPECQLSEEILAGSVGVTQQTVNNWIKDIRQRYLLYHLLNPSERIWQLKLQSRRL